MNGVLAELNSERQKRGRGSEADAPAEAAKKAKAPVLTTALLADLHACLLYTSPSPRDGLLSRMPSSA